MDINSTPILTFTISDENRENYAKIGITEYSFDRTKLLFQFNTNLDRSITVPIKRGQKSKEIVEIIQQALIKGLPPMSDSIKELFESSFMPDLESQIADNIERIYKSYAEEQREINPFVRDAITHLSVNPRKLTKKDIESVFDTMKKEAADDDLALKLIFYSGKSSFTNLIVGIVVDSKEAGAGKSYLINLYMTYEDPKYLRVYTYLSEKALYHQEGIKVFEDENGKLVEVTPILSDLHAKLEDAESNYEAEHQKSKARNAPPEERRDPEVCRQLKRRIDEIKEEISTYENKTEKLIIFTYKIVVILDTPDDNIFTILMSTLSQDTARDATYSFTDKDSKGHNTARNIRIRGTPGFLYSQVVDNTKNPRFREVNRRFPHANPNTTTRKIRNANKLIWANFSLTADERDRDIISREDKQRAREIMSLIDAKLIVHSSQFGHKESGVRLPFQATMESLASDKSPWQMTVQERATKYLSVITRVNMDFRPKLVDKRTGQTYIFVLFEA